MARVVTSGINTHHADAEIAIVTGDLTHWGEPEAYRNFRESMQALQVPYLVLVGNHDRRAACLEALSAAPRDSNGFVQGWRDTPREDPTPPSADGPGRGRRSGYRLPRK